MIRNSFALVCSLFALFFLLGLSSQSHASSVVGSGSILDASGNSVALFFSGNNALTNYGTISLTTSASHYYASPTTVSFTLGGATGTTLLSVSISATATHSDGGVSITGTLTRPDANTSYTANFTVVSGIGTSNQKTTNFSSVYTGSVLFTK